LYAIVDIETTGGYAAANGITEICIHVFDGNEVVEKFESLVNPGQPIPRYIQAFTGITDEMVVAAPRFEEVAPKVHGLLQDKIFIAHNVNFDYSFVKSHLQECGFDLNSKKLCTVRLSRKIFPGLPSYSLGNLCHSLDIHNPARHRAGGDTEATVEVFRKLLLNDREQHIAKSLLRKSKEQSLPPNVPKEDFERLPYTPGVYYFHNNKGKVIYVGKANNIRHRVSSHFSNNSEGRQKQNFMRYTYGISFEPCATELMACILESSEIKKLWPIFNYSQKRYENVYGIYNYEDQRGYQRLVIEKNKKQLSPVYRFHYLIDGHAVLRKLVKDYNLSAEEISDPPETYNSRVYEAIRSLQEQPSFAIVEKGRHAEERSCILVINGKFYGMGYLSNDTPINDITELKDQLTQYKENSYILNLIFGYAYRFPSKVIKMETAVNCST
jgi:DNA polymerase III subunit epsilon